MPQVIWLNANDATAKRLAAKAFPGYNGHTFLVEVHDEPGMRLDSHWDGGSRSSYAVLKLSTEEVLPMPENGSGFGKYRDAIEAPLPAPDLVVVEHCIFCGKDMGIRIHIHRENAAKLLPAPVELTWAEKVVLIATRSLKSSYAGIRDYRFHEANRYTRISRADWDVAKAVLIQRGLLDKRGAITPEGRNAAQGDLWRLGKERP